MIITALYPVYGICLGFLFYIRELFQVEYKTSLVDEIVSREDLPGPIRDSVSHLSIDVKNNRLIVLYNTHVLQGMPRSYADRMLLHSNFVKSINESNFQFTVKSIKSNDKIQWSRYDSDNKTLTYEYLSGFCPMYQDFVYRTVKVVNCFPLIQEEN